MSEHKEANWFKNAFSGTLGVVIGLNLMWIIPVVVVLIMCCSCSIFSLILPTGQTTNNGGNIQSNR
jgi:uncharacterized membrane protein HdeD (DUF308 family)